jgi:putative selenate reductase
MEPTPAARCLGCNAVCEICADVCPNRANVALYVADSIQIIHIDRLCNECGNCVVFCPTGGDPFKDKFTIFQNAEDFADSTNRGFLPLADAGYKLRLEDGSVIEVQLGDPAIPPAYEAIITTVTTDYPYLLGDR